MYKYCKKVEDIFNIINPKISFSTLRKHIYKLKHGEFYKIPDSNFKIIFTKDFIKFDELPT